MSIKLKAAFLLTAFALNTIVGFACAVGLNMGFNSHHHKEEATEATEAQESSEHHDKSHHHDDADHHKSKDGKDNCCNDKVIKFEQADKAFPRSSNTVINPEFVTSFFFSLCNSDGLYASQHIPNIKYFVRNYHPPIPDIRIAIRSFQI
ncbi:MAG TPA: hypothetical protein VK483_15805 [Chitinophagaceae bacterium]|nr:hypothetical protein [Chitinophagaceae bacterium]